MPANTMRACSRVTIDEFDDGADQAAVETAAADTVQLTAKERHTHTHTAQAGADSGTNGQAKTYTAHWSRTACLGYTRIGSTALPAYLAAAC